MHLLPSLNTLRDQTQARTHACRPEELHSARPLQVHAEPPVYVAHGFLSDDECSLLRQAATAGQLQPLPYDNKALVDTHRLWPLVRRRHPWGRARVYGC